MKDSLPPLEADVAELLRAERVIDPVPASEMRRALAATLSRAPTPLARPGWTAPSVLRAVGIFTAGGLVGAGLHAELAPPRIQYVTERIETPAPPTPSNAGELPRDGLPPTPASVSAPPPRPIDTTADRTAPGSVAAPRGTDTLAAERALVDVARRALGEADGAAALNALARHEQRFPSGLLQEEREALTVKALAMVGRRDDARARAARFQSKYPRSLFAASVARAVQEEAAPGKP